MNAIRFSLLALLLGISLVRAQITVEAEFGENDYLVGEDIILKVRIGNVSGQKLFLGDTADWLTFTVESRDGYVVEKLQDVAVRGEFTLETSEGAIKRVNLEPCFALGRVGRYHVTATVKVNQWGGRSWTSQPANFTVVSGAAMMETNFGVPRADGPPEMRRYSLVKSVRSNDARLYFRLSDLKHSRVLRTFQVGTLVSFSNPEVLLDRMNNYHVLYQSGGRSFLYFAANTEGFLIRRELHEIADSRPKLVTKEDGEVIVIGGVRRVTREDIPPFKEEAVPQPTEPPPVPPPAPAAP